MCAPFGAVVNLLLVDRKGIERRVDHQINVAAAPAIPASRPAAGDKFLAPERDNPVAAIPGFDIDACLVKKHCPIVVLAALGIKPRAAAMTLTI